MPVKRTLLAFLLFFLSGSSFGQKIHFTDTTNVWHGYRYDDADIPYYCDPETFSYSGDTVIRGVNYKILDPGPPTYAMYIREDVSKKVFVLSPHYPPPNDTVEQLLYDFSLNLGDTFKSYNSTYKVAVFDSVLINSAWHRVFSLEPLSYSGPPSVPRDYWVVEGIGCLTSPLFPLDPAIFEGDEMLTCFNSNGITPLLSYKVGGYFDNATSCGIMPVPLWVNNVRDKTKGSLVVPNPINETSKINLPYNIQSGTLAIFNDVGQSIFNNTFQNMEELLIGDKINTRGIYFYRVIDNQSGNVFSGKFVY